jgi:hypothetical protein
MPSDFFGLNGWIARRIAGRMYSESSTTAAGSSTNLCGALGSPIVSNVPLRRYAASDAGLHGLCSSGDDSELQELRGLR